MCVFLPVLYGKYNLGPRKTGSKMTSGPKVALGPGAALAWHNWHLAFAQRLHHLWAKFQMRLDELGRR
jgi:hypothetical protein